MEKFTSEIMKQHRELITNICRLPWRGDRRDGTVKYALLSADGDEVLKVDHKNAESGFLSIHGDDDEKYVMVAANNYPYALDEIARLQQEVAAHKAVLTRIIKDNPDRLSHSDVIRMLDEERKQ